MHKRTMETKVSDTPRPVRIDREKLAMAIRLKRGSRSYRDVEPEAKVYFRSLQQFETGAALPRVDTFAQICDWLGMRMEEFVIEGEAA